MATSNVTAAVISKEVRQRKKNLRIRHEYIAADKEIKQLLFDTF